MVLDQGTFHLIGIMSGGFECIAPGKYARVSYFMDWIAQEAFP